MQTTGTDWKAGRVKFYDQSKRIGFVVGTSDGKDVFLHLSAVQRSRVHPSTLLPDTEVQYSVRPTTRPGLRPEVHEIRVAMPRPMHAKR
jgi:cold shock CspA family protein